MAAHAKALEHAHQRNVVHHDVKPGNVLIANGSQDDEHVLLGDFGVARAVGNADDPGRPDDDDSTLAATLAYAAPEVITGDSIDGRADIYSLGCTLFRMLTGKRPFGAPLALAHLHHTPPRISDHLPGANRQLDVVMARALAKSPEDRFRSAREFAAAAAAASTSLTERSMPSTPRGAAVPIATRLPLDRLRSNASERTCFQPIPSPRAAPSVLRRPLVILWSIFAAVALIAAVVWARLLWPSSSAPEASVPATSTTATTSAAPAPAALGRARTDLGHVTKAGTQPNATEGP